MLRSWTWQHGEEDVQVIEETGTRIQDDPERPPPVPIYAIYNLYSQDLTVSLLLSPSGEKAFSVRLWEHFMFKL